MKLSLLRRNAAFFLDCNLSTNIRVLYRWRRVEDNVPAVRLEILIDGQPKRVTLYCHAPGTGFPMP
jgi:hypothetical protein